MFQDLVQQLRAALPISAETASEPPAHHIESEFQWEDLLEEIPQVPSLPEESWPKVFKLAQELCRQASLMSAGRDLNDLHTVLTLLAHLLPKAKDYAAH
jgi:hypothetical protein